MGIGTMQNWLDCPSKEEWDLRQKWFEEVAEVPDLGWYDVGEQASALIGEAQTAFCAGAWVAVIVLCMAVVDAQLRETEFPEFSGNTKELVSYAQGNPSLHRLRKRRNDIIHVDPDNPAITLNQQWSNREILEKEARDAVTLMFEAFYSNPGV
jgi:hypothetical protein